MHVKKFWLASHIHIKNPTHARQFPSFSDPPDENKAPPPSSLQESNSNQLAIILAAALCMSGLVIFVILRSQGHPLCVAKEPAPVVQGAAAQQAADGVTPQPESL